MDLLGLGPPTNKSYNFCYIYYIYYIYYTLKPQLSHYINMESKQRERESAEEVHLGQRFDKGNQKEFDID